MLRVTTLAMQIELSSLIFIKASTPLYQIGNSLWGVADNYLNSLTITLASTADKGILNVFLKGVGIVSYLTDATLCIVCVALGKFTLCDDSHRSYTCSFKRKTQACRTGTNYQKIALHCFKVYFLCKDSNLWRNSDRYLTKNHLQNQICNLYPRLFVPTENKSGIETIDMT